jgi:hypothetical protein
MREFDLVHASAFLTKDIDQAKLTGGLHPLGDQEIRTRAGNL